MFYNPQQSPVALICHRLCLSLTIRRPVSGSVSAEGSEGEGLTVVQQISVQPGRCT